MSRVRARQSDNDEKINQQVAQKITQQKNERDQKGLDQLMEQRRQQEMDQMKQKRDRELNDITRETVQEPEQEEQQPEQTPGEPLQIQQQRVLYNAYLEYGKGQEDTEQKKAVMILIEDPRITQETKGSVLHYVESKEAETPVGRWIRESTLMGQGYAIAIGVNGFSPFVLAADPATLAAPSAECTFRPEGVKVQDGVLWAKAEASGIRTAAALAGAVAENRAADKGAVVTIDLTTSDAAYDVCALTLTGEACKALQEGGVKQLDVKAGQISLSLDAQALQSLYAANGDVTLRADRTGGYDIMDSSVPIGA